MDPEQGRRLKAEELFWFLHFDPQNWTNYSTIWIPSLGRQIGPII